MAGFLEDRVLVVAGVGPDLGRQIAVRGAAAGADVVLAARTAARLEEVAKEIADQGRRALVVPTDLTSAADAERLAEVFDRRHHQGVVHERVDPAEFGCRGLGEVELDAVQAGFDNNVIAALRLTRLFIPALAATSGAVVLVNSMVVRFSQRTMGPYKMAKASLLAMAGSLATELGPQGIRVNSVAPGHIWGESLKWYFGYLGHKRGVSVDDIYTETAAATDLKRLPEPDEIADAVLFLASPLARAITGQCLDVNCGEYHH
jgi:NAD(P)-dependent dehydrogenase (short-subunit alcohol dehydrogenase family)